jgi:hypothetical protein
MVKKNKKLIIFGYFIGIIVLYYILFYSQEYSFHYKDICNHSIRLEKDGLCILYNPIYAKETNGKPCSLLEIDILRELPQGYKFIDYIYKIENSSLSTFHRDVTSSQRIFKTKYTVYTVILYKYDGELFSFCPGSNHTYPFTWSRIINIHGYKGTVFLFDSDILHAGGEPIGIKREVIQYKVCHRDDLELLTDLIGVRMEKKEEKKSSFHFGKRLLRKISYFFEMPINTFLYPFMLKRENSNHWIGKIQNYIPISFYNNG